MEMNEVLKLTASESVEIRSSTPEALEVEATYAAHGEAPPKHLHPGQDERFRVREGRLTVRVADERRELGAGDELEIPRGTVHQMWNPSNAPARVTWVTSPGGRTERWFRELDALQEEGRVGDNGLPGPLAFGVLLTEYRDVIRLAGPQPLILPALAGLALVGRARGYRAALA